MTRIPIWLDCDPGHDDAVAILLALFHPSFELVAISTTYGNSSIENTTYNTLSLLTLLHKEHKIPVYSGTSRPLVKDTFYAPYIHGKSGLDGTDLPIPIIKSQIEIDDTKKLNEAIWEAIQQHGNDLCIVSVGPLTNMAKFFTEFPNAKHIIKKLSIMGGGFDGVYNKGQSEFNIWCDPKATKIILEDNVLSSKVILSPLNVTHKVLCTPTIQSKILAGSLGETKLRKTFYELMTFFADSYSKRQEFKLGPPVHDPIAVYALLEECSSSKSIGLIYKTLKIHCIENGKEEGKFDYIEDSEGSKVIFGINVETFWDTFLQVLENADNYVHDNKIIETSI